MDRKVNFAIIGLGNISNIHALAINNIENACLKAVYGRNIEKAKNFAQKYNVEKVYTDLPKMLTDREIEAVCILTPSGLHGELGKQVAKAKKHVIVEKPIDITLDKADELIKTCEEEGVKLAVISQHRMDQSIIKVKEAVDNGDFGRLVLGDAHIKWFRSQEYYDSDSWRGTWELDGGGALINQSIHTIDLLLYIMGDVDSLYAYCNTLGHERIEVEDVATATLRFKNGALGTIIGSTAVYPGLPARLEINGTKGSATIEGDEIVYWNCLDPQKSINIVDNTHKTGASNPMDIDYIPHKLQLEGIVDAIINDKKIKCDGYEGRRALEVILAIYDSAKTGKPVVLKN
ncbi:Gfo/Idh/MocA family protein [Paramaledivibacter caminithermalis]|jgi:predicted dehydrogenase|uniref:Predicted dehydrogenase n=1 Tax=Paramaledivibacter caminithermalis (strain DSM 15212 / CIP 107654 / DViRD3) TaxID=1121301 RepID=A0A1M6NT80_PARC5|nr:Gfo/Idh/MocA family oxidoreductase [Paramaledivibacter caminithermalis]SHJ98854.1 Predicted dehydrogenase [Paramaledivibacter caminithermalis DSM 15212]